MRRSCAVAGLVVCAVSSVARAQGGLPPINVPVTVRDWVGQAVEREPAWGGVPIASRLIRNVNGLCLVDEKGKAVPAQFEPLVTDRDGYVRWVLVDCQLDLQPGQERTLTLKTGANPAPDAELQYQRAGDLMQVTTGPMRFAVNTRHYNFLDSVWIDANRNGRFDRPERIVVPTDTPNVVAVEAQTGIPYTSLAVRPGTVRFEHKGPLRAVMVMEGDLADDQGRVLVGYRTRITAFAGKALLLVEHSLRNSRKDGGADVAIKRSELGLGLADDLTQYHVGREDGKTADGALLEDDEVRVRQEGSPGPDAQAAYQMTLAGKQGVRKLCAGSEAPGWVFASSAARGVFLFDRDFLADAPTEVTQRRGRLVYHDVPPSGTEAFVLPDLSLEASRLVLDFAARSADRIEPKAVIDRTRSPLMLLPNAAYVARLGALGGPFATVEDQEKVSREILKGNDKERPTAPNATSAPAATEEYGHKGGWLRWAVLELVRTRRAPLYVLAEKWSHSEAYGRKPFRFRTDGFDSPGGSRKRMSWVSSPLEPTAGLVDWYCLTGEVEALEAAVDLAEHADSIWSRGEPGKEPISVTAPLLGFGTSLAGLCRVYEATCDERWLKTIHHMIQTAARTPGRTERGALDFAPVSENERPHQEAAASYGLWRAWAVTDSEDARDLVIGQARMIQKHQSPALPSLDCLSHAYDLTGDASFLETARTFWAKGGTILGGPLSADTGVTLNDACARLFFWYMAHPRADAQPPKAVTDLEAKPGPNKRAIYLTWTAPEDQGGGEVAVYQVKRADLPIVDDKAFDYAKDKGKRRSWWFAANLTDEPAPGKPGASVRFLVKDLAAGTYYFALKSRDDSSNESPLSNVVAVEIK